jgi:hypothetical protein
VLLFNSYEDSLSIDTDIVSPTRQINVYITENQNVYAQLGISHAEILSNRTNSGTDIINSRSNDNGTPLDVITPIPSVNSTSIGRATPSTGNPSVEDSNIMGEAGQPPSGIN